MVIAHVDEHNLLWIDCDGGSDCDHHTEDEDNKKERQHEGK
jgi:hypothetical protein